MEAFRRAVGQPFHRTRFRRWCVSFVLVAGLICSWLLATPIFAAPDEPAHLIHAIGVAHGQWLGHEYHGQRGLPPLPPTFRKATLVVTAPAAYHDDGGILCVAFRPNVSARCLALDPLKGNRPAFTYTARYFPAYYLGVGLVSRFTRPGARQVLLMRLVGALLSAALIASAIVTMLEVMPSLLALTGLAIALTPMAFFVAGTINPNGIEIAAAIGVWVHGAAIAFGGLRRIGPRLITRLGVAATILAVSRPTSLLWVAIIGILLLFCIGWRNLKDVARRRSAQVWLAVLGVAVALQLGWAAWAHAFDPSNVFNAPGVPASKSQFLRTTIGMSNGLLHQMIGVFGWVDTQAPSITYIGWLIALGALAGIAVLVARRRFLWTIGATTVVVAAIPIVVQAAYVHKIGYAWEGRYTLPVAVGIPIVAGLGIGLARLPVIGTRRFATLTLSVLVIAQFFAFAQALRRYTVGANGTIWYPWNAQWHAPVPTLLLLIAFAGLLVAGTVLLLRATNGTSPRTTLADDELQEPRAVDEPAAVTAT